jgi:hypothetical protein
MGTACRSSISMLAAALAVVALAGACGDGGDEAVIGSDATRTAATAEAITGTPMEEDLACASGSTERFREIDADAPWAVYCPTFLPEGYALEDISYGLDLWGAVPAAGVGAMEARFVNAETGGRITFVQGTPGLSALTSGVRGGEALGDIPYGDSGLAARLSQSPLDVPDGPFFGVMASSGEHTHWIEAVGTSEEETRSIAAGMRPVETLP